MSSSNNTVVEHESVTKPVWPMALILVDVLSLVVVAVVGFLSSKPSMAEELRKSETIMEDTTTDSSVVDPTKKELPVARRELLKRPPVAYPTIVLLIVALSLYFGSLIGFIKGYFAWYQSLFLSTLGVYWSFTVLHDAVHIAIAPRMRWLNELCGSLAGIPLFAPLSLFRYIHLSHHRHSGDDDLDPDAYAGHGPEFLLPLRWLTILHNYLYYFSRTMRMRAESGISDSTKRKDQQMIKWTLPQIPLLLISLLGMYHVLPGDKAMAPIVCILLPQHLGVMFLAYLFDYVPHRPHVIPYKEDPFQSTNATSLWGSVDHFLWNWAALGQQLHIVHHIWPFMPFYTYKELWAAHGEEILAKGTRVAPLIILGSRATYFAELNGEASKEKTS